MKKLKLFIITLLCSIQVFGQHLTLPEKSNKYINDYAGVMTDAQKESLASICKKQEENSTAQIVVVITNDVPEDYPIAEYSQELFEKWGIGQAGIDNGLLIVVFPNQRQSRVHVGYGLEGALTDGYTKTAQKEHLNPHFKQGDYFGGLQSLLNAFTQKIDPEAIAFNKEMERIKAEQRAETTEKVFNWFLGLLLAGLIAGVIIYLYRKQKRQEKERLREEEEARQLKIYQEAQRQREIERIKAERMRQIQQARSQTTQVKRLYDEKQKIIQIIANNDFLNSKDILQQLLLLENDIPVNLPEEFDADAIQKQCNTVRDNITTLTQDILTKWEKKAHANVAILESDKVLKAADSRLQLLTNLVNELGGKYGEDIWNYPIRMMHFKPKNLNASWTKIINTISQLRKDIFKSLEENDFDQARVHTADLNGVMTMLDDIDQEIVSKEKQVQEADNYVNKTMYTIQQELAHITSLMNNKIVNFTTQEQYLSYVKGVNLKNFTDKSRCILTRQNDLIEFVYKINSYKTSANKDVSDYHAEIARVAAEKKAAEDRARRERERKERERREEDDRRNSYYSSSSYNSSSSSSSSSSSNSSDFGGGSSGGGGSDNSW